MHLQLVSIIDELIEETKGQERVKVGRMLGFTGKRGIALMLIFPMVLTILPSGMIPFFPAVMAIIMIFIAAHMLIGAPRIWVPKFLSNYEMPASALHSALLRMRKGAIWLDRWADGRFSWVLEIVLIERIIALVVVAYSVTIIVFGFIPGLPALLSFALLPLAIGTAMQNGLILLSGIAVNAMVFAIIWFLLL